MLTTKVFWLCQNLFGLASILYPLSHLSVNAGGLKPSAIFNLTDGFECVQVASDVLAHDPLSMTLDGRGNPVLSGPGYIKTLIDDNSDGVYDRAITWTNQCKQGAQGLCFDDHDLLWVGDGGLWKSFDRNHDQVADGPPTKIFSVGTGGEHDAHAIRRGPDGYYYLVAGNFASNVRALQTDSDPSVVNPRSGTFWRISPDLKSSNVWAHGFRNTYGFDFLSNGQIVTFDSDEEREMGLPWYRFTRVVVVSPGCDGGWVDVTWFDHDWNITMPQTIAKLGRASPTGVAVYHHNTFPTKYHEAIFVLDWAQGRVIAVYPQPVDPKDLESAKQANLPPPNPSRFMSETFLQTNGTAGFSPTAITVAPDGSLLVCTGGRGTPGAIYRISPAKAFTGNEPTLQAKSGPPANAKSIMNASLPTTILDSPCHYEQWSMNQWREVLKRKPPTYLDSILALDTPPSTNAVDRKLVAARKRRAAQIAALSNAQVTKETWKKLLFNDSSVDRSTAWWLAGHHAELKQTISLEDLPSEMEIFQSVDSEEESFVDRLLGGLLTKSHAEASGLRHWPITELMIEESAGYLNATILSNYKERWKSINPTRQLQLWAASRSNQLPAGSMLIPSKDEQAVGSAFYRPITQGLNGNAMDALARKISAKKLENSSSSMLQALAILQVSLGSFRESIPRQQAPLQVAVDDGYRSMFGKQLTSAIREGWSKWCLKVISNPGDEDPMQIRSEAIRTLAMLEPESSEAIDICLSQITELTHPTNDIHTLMAVASCRASRKKSQTLSTANALSNILYKARSLAMKTEGYWTLRLEQLFRRLEVRDQQLQDVFVDRPDFGRIDDLQWIAWCNPAVQVRSKLKWREQLLRTPVKKWPLEIVRFVAGSTMDSELKLQLRNALVQQFGLSKIELAGSDQNEVTNSMASDIESASPASGVIPASWSEPPVSATERLGIQYLAPSPNSQDYDWLLGVVQNLSREQMAVAWKGISTFSIEQPKREWEILPILAAKNQTVAANNAIQQSILSRLRSVAKSLNKTELPADDSWNSWSSYLSSNLEPTMQDRFRSVVESSATQALSWDALVDAALDKPGDSGRGQELYQSAKCNQCHSSNSALGPSLTGVSKRFARDEIFAAIYEPNRDVSDRYRAMKVLTSDGNVLTGMKIYEGNDGVTLQTADGEVVRISQEDIELKAPAESSLMPAGLLEGFTLGEVADLYAYLQTL